MQPTGDCFPHCRQVPSGVVLAHNGQERLPPPMCGALTGIVEQRHGAVVHGLEVDARQRRRPLARHTGCAAPLDVGHTERSIPSDSTPRARERREDCVRAARALLDRAGGDGIRRANTDEPPPVDAQAFGDYPIAPSTVRAVVAGDVDSGRTHLGGELRHDVGRVTVSVDERTLRGIVERAERTAHELAPRRSGTVEGRIDHEERHHRPIRSRSMQCRQIGESQVAPEPHHCRDATRTHADSVADASTAPATERTSRWRARQPTAQAASAMTLP